MSLTSDSKHVPCSISLHDFISHSRLVDERLHTVNTVKEMVKNILEDDNEIIMGLVLCCSSASISLCNEIKMFGQHLSGPILTTTLTEGLTQFIG